MGARGRRAFIERCHQPIPRAGGRRPLMRGITLHPFLLVVVGSDDHHSPFVLAGGGHRRVAEVDILNDVPTGDGLQLEAVEFRAPWGVKRDRRAVRPVTHGPSVPTHLSKQGGDEP